MQKISIIHTTVGNSEVAEQLATKLVETKLAGCVQIDGPLASIYHWQGKLQKDTEFRLSCKTTLAQREIIVEFLQANHPYEVPEIVVIDVEPSQSYAAWIAAEVSGKTGQ